MPTKARRCTLVIAAAAVVAALLTAGLVHWSRPDVHQNEARVIALLKNLSSAQLQAQASGFADEDGDGAGRYMFLSELIGARPVRTADGNVAPLVPPVFAVRDRVVLEGDGRPVRVARFGGYYVAVFLPGPDGTWVGDPVDDGPVGPGLDHEVAEVAWTAYAWPVYSWTGTRVFLVTEGGDVLAARNAEAPYVGGRHPRPGVAGFAPDATGPFDRCLAPNTLAADGRRWFVS